MTIAATTFDYRFERIAGLPMSGAGVASRVDFVDYSKGLCILLVVMMHSTLGVGNAVGSIGWMHIPVEFSRPFRMPDFFLISGLFLAKTINTTWRRYLDRKVLHFAYFYILWTAIHLTVKITTLADPSLTGLTKAFAWAMIEPGTPLWFIYLLPIFFVVTRLLKPVPWQIVLPVAALLEAWHVTGHGMVAYEFTYRFVYFYAGYRFAPLIFAFADKVALRPALSICGLAIWAMVNAIAVFKFTVGGVPLAQLPGIGLILGFSGALAIVTIASLLAEFKVLQPLSWLGQNTIIVFTAFVLFMAPARIILVKLGLIQDVGVLSLIVMTCAWVGPLILAAVVEPTPLRYLFKRPQWAKLRDS